MKIGLVCPYTWDVPGGVQAHVRELARTLDSLGHEVSVLAPALDADAELPDYVVNAGRTVPIRYNGSVARLAFGPRSAGRAKRWLLEGDFDVVHIHEPFAPSVSLLALWAARGPVVATFHASVVRSRALETVEPALRPALEKIHARIAVSPAARTYVVNHLGGSCLTVPNGVDVRRFAEAEPLPGWPGESMTVGFLGRIDEPRKGLPTLLEAFGPLAAAHPGLRLLVAGPGDVDEVREELPGPWAHRVELLGLVSEEDKARFYRSIDVYCAPNLGGESFGIVLLEAMAAGTPVVASDLDAFRVTLDGAGELVPPDDPAALAAALDSLLNDPDRRTAMAERGRAVVARYDWPEVARQLVEIYETVAGEKVSADRAPMDRPRP
ncbi:MAG TPA: glycosyltransferase family 4 protein [Mycobacteriales bacterium]|nr:glycosyltransferase family 4 protein [Mycobacteriales bacterium]